MPSSSTSEVTCLLKSSLTQPSAMLFLFPTDSFWSAHTVPYTVKRLQRLLLLNYCLHSVEFSLFLAACFKHLRSTWGRSVICRRGSSPALVSCCCLCTWKHVEPSTPMHTLLIHCTLYINTHTREHIERIFHLDQVRWKSLQSSAWAQGIHDGILVSWQITVSDDLLCDTLYTWL